MRPAVVWLVGATLTGAGALAWSAEPTIAPDLPDVGELARAADVIGIGEVHDNPAHHAIQSLALDRLVAAGERPVLAFEMLTEDQQAAVDEALREASSMQDLDHRLAWRARRWPDFSMYYPLFETARREGLPVLAADLSAELRRRVSHGGLGALPEPERTRLESQLPVNAAREDALWQEIQAGHCDLLPPAAEASMVEAWHARNVTMARRIAGALARGLKVVLIAGRAHLAADAVPGQLAALRPGTRVRIIDLVERDGDPPLANADVVLTTPGVNRPDECAELRRHPPKWQ